MSGRKPKKCLSKKFIRLLLKYKIMHSFNSRRKFIINKGKRITDQMVEKLIDTFRNDIKIF